jgi:DNA polymerase III alpha subunit (gram-positive type)
MRAYVSSSIETFQLDNINFNKDFQTQNEIIRRYDEVLSQKASKQLIEEKIMQQDDRLQKQLKNVHAITDSLAEELRAAGKKLDDFKVLMFEEVATQV